MTDRVDTAALLALRAEGTQGEWEKCGCNKCGFIWARKHDQDCVLVVASLHDGSGDIPAEPLEKRQVNARLIVAAVNALEPLCREVEELRERYTNALFDIEAWKLATGLERGGDPDAVTPKDLETELATLRATTRQAEVFGACCALTALYAAITGEWDGVSGAEEAMRDDGFHEDPSVSTLLSETIDYVATLRAKLARVAGLVGEWRESAKHDKIAKDYYGTHGRALHDCADELEEALELPITTTNSSDEQEEQ